MMSTILDSLDKPHVVDRLFPKCNSIKSPDLHERQNGNQLLRDYFDTKNNNTMANKLDINGGGARCGHVRMNMNGNVGGKIDPYASLFERQPPQPARVVTRRWPLEDRR